MKYYAKIKNDQKGDCEQSQTTHYVEDEAFVYTPELEAAILKFNKVNLLGSILSTFASHDEYGGKYPVEQMTATVEKEIENMHSRLKPVIEDAAKYTDTRAKLLEELIEQRRSKFELSWELYWQKSHLLSTLQDAVKQNVEKRTMWRKEQIHYMISYIDTIYLKLISIEEKCMSQMYDPERSNKLEHISDILDDRISKTQEQYSKLRLELQELDRLPAAAVIEYTDIQDKINNYREYFARLEIA
mmetsp:Transcript_4261/g.5353  ORF Transcript_4261/g.5353 Transcript_4261/m.5353 type:complete len:244 (+) Transcript_4261:44-775(+)